MSTAGICMFAYNNESINYVRMAMLAALYAKKNAGINNICLITTEGDFKYLEETQDAKLIDKAFSDVVLAEVAYEKNIRSHYDSPWTRFNTQFTNNNKHEIIDLSPYDKTLLLDTDYFLQTDQLNYIFESDESIAMFQKARSLCHDEPLLFEQFLAPTSIPLWWSTVVYFDKSEESRTFFDLWAHIKDNWEFYQYLYGFPNNMYRTDFCVSIAVHILNGFQQANNFAVHEFINSPMVYMDQKDDIVEIKSATEWLYLSNNRKEQWKDTLNLVKNADTHVMNKRAIDRHYDSLLGAVLVDE